MSQVKGYRYLEEDNSDESDESDEDESEGDEMDDDEVVEEMERGDEEEGAQEGRADEVDSLRPRRRGVKVQQPGWEKEEEREE